MLYKAFDPSSFSELISLSTSSSPSLGIIYLFSKIFNMHPFTIALYAIAALPFIVAHGDPTRAELEKRDLLAAHTVRSLGACAENDGFKALHREAAVRRAATLQRLRLARDISPTKRTLHRRDLTQFESWENVNHNMCAPYLH